MAAVGGSAYDPTMPNDTLRLIRMRRLAATGAARAMREAAGLSLREAGQGAGLSPVTVYRWEHGMRRPSAPAALRYLDLLEAVSG